MCSSCSVFRRAAKHHKRIIVAPTVLYNHTMLGGLRTASLRRGSLRTPTMHMRVPALSAALPAVPERRRQASPQTATPLFCIPQHGISTTPARELAVATGKNVGRPISPHVFIYAFPVVALSSITVRITGVLLTVGASSMCSIP
jgi:hypothetical protein